MIPLTWIARFSAAVVSHPDALNVAIVAVSAAVGIGCALILGMTLGLWQSSKHM